MQLGLIGLPNRGKTTVFNVLTGFNAQTGYFHKNEPNIAVVEVLDPRVTTLSELYKPQKTTYSIIEVIDFPGDEEETQKMRFDSPQMKQLDALCLVLRNFDDQVLNQSIGEPDPLKELQEIESEMLINDMQVAEKRLDKVRLNLQRGVRSAENQYEEKVLEKVVNILNAEKPLRTAELLPEEEKVIRGFQLLTIKQVMIIINSDENRLGKNTNLLEQFHQMGYEAIDIAGKFEMELLSLEPDDAELFLYEMGISVLARDKIIQMAYRVLGYISFFTVSNKEVRSWTITKGDNAQEAAGKIHSDMERGFIRAECFHYNDLIEYGSEKALKEKGKIRVEGKSYIVNDGDVLFIRFSV
ncbi:MAG: YchF family ATPase [Candidatus Cloacimonetes bacterium]|nr:YchF family ATPase [Candidatus Cloacimonadota bacterium]